MSSGMWTMTRRLVLGTILSALSVGLASVAQAGTTPAWSDNFDGGAQQTWAVANGGANSTTVVQNDRYELHTEGATPVALASYVNDSIGNAMIQGRVKPINIGDEFLAYLLMRGTPASGNGYVLGISTGDADNSTPDLRNPHLWLGKLVGGAYSSLAAPGTPPTFSAADCQLKFALINGNLYGKVWSTGAAEPAAWQIQATDNSYASGVGGVMVATYPALGWTSVQAAFDDVTVT